MEHPVLLLLYLISFPKLLEWSLHLRRTGLLIPNFSLSASRPLRVLWEDSHRFSRTDVRHLG